MKNYLFDFDGTLADSKATAIYAIQAAFRDAGLTEPADDRIRYYMGVPIEVSFPKLVSEQGQSTNDKQLEEMFLDFRQKYQVMEEENTFLFSGIEEMLSDLKLNGKRLFIVSSKVTESLKRNLANLGIDKFFEDIVGSDQVNHYKPAPDGIDLLLDKYQLDKAQTVMIGDAMYDLQMGKNAGVKTCGCEWGAYDVSLLENEHPDYLIKKPFELTQI